MRTDSWAFHIISLVFTVVGVWMYFVSGDPIGLACALFFGGGWVGTQAIRRGNSRGPRIVAGLACLLVAGGCVFMLDAPGGGLIYGLIGAVFFGACGLVILGSAFFGGRSE